MTIHRKGERLHLWPGLLSCKEKKVSAMMIKNWKQFQHFKDRRPPWIKLYRTLLDDPEWFDLPAESARVLINLWLIASEYGGTLPETKVLAFRLRMDETKVGEHIATLSHWLTCNGDIKMISKRYHDDTPETEGETEKEIEKEEKPARSFQKPTVEEVKAFCAEKGYAVDALKFWNYYESNGWKVGRVPMKRWQAAIITWTRNSTPSSKSAIVYNLED